VPTFPGCCRQEADRQIYACDVLKGRPGWHGRRGLRGLPGLAVKGDKGERGLPGLPGQVLIHQVLIILLK